MSEATLKAVYAAQNDAVAAEIHDNQLCVTTRDGRTISVPLDWWPSLVNASDAQRQKFEVLGAGVHWPELDEYVSMEVLLLGRASQ